MRYREFGRTGLKVSEIGFGAWAIGGNAHGNSYGPTDDKESLEAVKRALDLGCNFFDTADVYGYGHSEELLGEALSGSRDSCVIATKVGGDFYSGATRLNFSPDYTRFALRKSLERLRTDHVDVYQLHNPPLELLGRLELYKPLVDLKEEGLIRFYGVSIHHQIEGLEAMEVGGPHSLQVVYNMLSQEPSRELFPAASERGVAIIAREPLANGFLTGKLTLKSRFQPGDIRYNWPRDYIERRLRAMERLRFLERPGERTLAQAALQFALADKAVSVAIVGCKTVAQVEENMHAPEASPLNQDEIRSIKEEYERDLR